MTWKTPVIAATILTFIIVPKISRRLSAKVLGEQTVVEITTIALTDIPTPTESPKPIPTASPSATLKPKPTPKPDPTPKPQPKFSSEEIYNFTENFAIQYGIDPNVLRHVALCESGFRPEAKNGIYVGLFQYDQGTWKNFRTQMGLDSDPDLRFNAQAAVQTTAYALSRGFSRLWPNCYPH